MEKRILAAALVLMVVSLIVACAPQVTPTPTVGFGQGTVAPTFPAGTETAPVETETPFLMETPTTSAGATSAVSGTPTPLGLGTTTP